MKLSNLPSSNFLSYKTYRENTQTLIKTGKAPGMDYKESQLSYVRLNEQRMRRLDKTIELEDELIIALQNLKHNWVWVVLTESWCGDAAQNLPAIAAMAAVTPKVELHLLLRDKNPIVMNHYLTGESRSIPKLICFNKETEKEVFTWGPRPEYLQNLKMDFIAGKLPNVTKEQVDEEIQRWYNTDKTKSVQKEFIALIKTYD